jgi:hypothetical protein
MFVREVARIDDPQFVSGQVAGHRARRLIDAPDAAFAKSLPRRHQGLRRRDGGD